MEEPIDVGMGAWLENAVTEKIPRDPPSGPHEMYPRELDELVERQVFGSDVSHGYVFRREIVECPDGKEGCCVAHWGDVPYPVPRYSTDMREAWKVVEAAKIVIIARLDTGEWSAARMGQLKLGKAKMAARAVCLAALDTRQVGGEVVP